MVVFLSGRIAVYVTPAGLPWTISAGPNAPVVPGTGTAAWTTASAARAVARSEGCIFYLTCFRFVLRNWFLSSKSLEGLEMEEKHGLYLKYQNIGGSIVEGKGNEMNEKWGNRVDHSPNERMQLTEKDIHN